jgi:hypothetical protein
MKNEAVLLKEKILLLQAKQTRELKILKEELHNTHELLKPLNFIKNTMFEVASLPDIKSKLLSGALGLVTGYLSKKVLFGTSNNPIKKMLGTALQFAIANVVVKKADDIVIEEKLELTNAE